MCVVQCLIIIQFSRWYMSPSTSLSVMFTCVACVCVCMYWRGPDLFRIGMSIPFCCMAVCFTQALISILFVHFRLYSYIQSHAIAIAMLHCIASTSRLQVLDLAHSLSLFHTSVCLCLYTSQQKSANALDQNIHTVRHICATFSHSFLSLSLSL